MQMSNPYLTRRNDSAAIVARVDPVVYEESISQGVSEQQKQDYAKNGASVDIAYGKSHRVCVEKVECLRWFRSLEE